MILSYALVSGQELDVVTIKGKSVKYKTGKAKDIIAPYVRRYGVRVAGMVYRDWSNGYVRTSEIG